MQSAPLTVKEAAAKLKKSEWKIYDMVKRKQIPHFRIGSSINFREETLDAWIARQEAANCVEVVVDEIPVEKQAIKASLRLFSGRSGKLSRFSN